MAFVLENATIASPLLEILPWITTWSRLEVLPSSADLSAGLQAPIADPLWLLHRQWAFLELHGEDAGTPIDLRLTGEEGHLTRFHPGPFGPTPGDDAIRMNDIVPMEVTVEREDPGPLRRHALATGQHLVRLLTDADIATAPLLASFPMEIPTPADPLADQAGAAWATVATGRAVDGQAVAAALRPLLDDDGNVADLPDGLAVPAGRRDQALAVLTGWLAHHDSILGPGTATGSWVPQRQEYAFAAGTRLSAGEVVVAAQEYSDGRLDWPDFVAATGPGLEVTAEPPKSTTLTPRIPTPVRYPGMPADRLWEFEDTTVNLGGLEAGPGDLGRLLLVEFGLVYGNDWFVVPVEMAVGSVFRVTDLQVRDTFGVTTRIGPSTNPTGGPAWEMYELATGTRGDAAVQDLFLLPPVLSSRLEGDPLEEIHWVRDEMANLAWGIERRVPGVSGDSYDRTLESSRLAVHQQVAGDPGSAQLVYRLQTPVPVHWIPFAPVAIAPVTSPDFDIMLERRALLRTLADGSTQEIHPTGTLLRTDLDRPVGSEPPLRVNDEEIPRTGAVVTRSFQYARWHDGSAHMWVGRAKRTGRGEASSGLRWDSSDKQG